jgi:MYXO-CTERM domain-containing protein
MKKLLLTTTALLTAVSLQAQGTVSFANNSAAAISNSLTSLRVVGGTTFSVALYFLPDSATPPTTADFDLARTVVGSGIFLGTAANPSGLFNVGARTAPTATAGGLGWFQVRAWETAFGGTYEAALNNPNAVGGRLALVGTSNIFKVDTGDPTTTPAGTAAPITGTGLLQGFYVTPVPEPTVMGLGLLGIGALLMLRRRSK